jgi:hypothetical protein
VKRLISVLGLGVGAESQAPHTVEALAMGTLSATVRTMSPKHDATGGFMVISPLP